MFALPWLKKRIRHPEGDEPSELYGFHQARVFTNGGQQFTFEFHKTLPLYSIIGPATAVLTPLRAEQWPQVFNPLSVPQVGLGGLQAGQLISQALVNEDFSPIG